MGTSFFSVQHLSIYRLYRFIQKLIKFPAQFCFLQSHFCFLHSIKALVFLRAFYIQLSLLGPFLCSLRCCTQPSFLGISVQPSLLHLTLFRPFFRLLNVSFFSHFFSSFFIVALDFLTILQPSFLVSSPKVYGASSLQSPLLYWFFEGIFWEIF